MANSVAYRRCTMEIQADYKKFLEWCIKEGKSIKREHDCQIIDGDFVRTEKRLARLVNINPTVIKEYEEATGDKFEAVGFIIVSD